MHCYPLANVQLFIVFCLSFSSWKDLVFFSFSITVTLPIAVLLVAPLVYSVQPWAAQASESFMLYLSGCPTPSDINANTKIINCHYQKSLIRNKIIRIQLSWMPICIFVALSDSKSTLKKYSKCKFHNFFDSIFKSKTLLRHRQIQWSLLAFLKRLL